MQMNFSWEDLMPEYFGKKDEWKAGLEVDKVFLIYNLMFLLNLFGRSGSQSEDDKFDRISFKIDLNENVPKFQDTADQPYIEEDELTPNHPMYY